MRVIIEGWRIRGEEFSIEGRINVYIERVREIGAIFTVNGRNLRKHILNKVLRRENVCAIICVYNKTVNRITFANFQLDSLLRRLKNKNRSSVFLLGISTSHRNVESQRMVALTSCSSNLEVILGIGNRGSIVRRSRVARLSSIVTTLRRDRLAEKKLKAFSPRLNIPEERRFSRFGTQESERDEWMVMLPSHSVERKKRLPNNLSGILFSRKTLQPPFISPKFNQLL